MGIYVDDDSIRKMLGALENLVTAIHAHTDALYALLEDIEGDNTKTGDT